LRKWQAIVPIKQGAASKSRLSGVLDDTARLALMHRMAANVLRALQQCPAIDSRTIVSPARPDSWLGGWVEDEGRGLNAEVAQWRERLGCAPALVIHADLPLVSSLDIRTLLAAAELHGSAMATDRAGLGTNALALGNGQAFDLRFGVMSRLHHTAQIPVMAVLQRVGLMVDLDTPDDLRFAESCGFRAAQACHWEGSTDPAGLHKLAKKFDEESIP